MKALLKNGKSVSVAKSAKPVATDSQVVIQVGLAGLCRTDIYAAQGKLKVRDPLILGHELAGTVDTVGSAVEGLKNGQRVTVNPILRCNSCNRCRLGESCCDTGFVGLDLDGGFAEYIAVPAYTVLPLADDVSFLHAAYTEPVAASLAVLKSGITPSEQGAIFGKNRFSELMQLILDLYGFGKLPVYDLASADDMRELKGLSGSFDYVIETFASSAVLKSMVAAIKPGGKMILKSRQYEPVAFKLIDVLKKEPVMHVVNYGSFDDALELLSSGKLNIDGLVDDVYALESFEQVFERASSSESLKPFFDPGM